MLKGKRLLSHLAYLSMLILSVRTLCAQAVNDLMRQFDKVVRQKQQHLVHEPAAPFSTTHRLRQKRPKLYPTHHGLLEGKRYPPWE